MIDYINKGDDYLSAEETIGYLLDSLGAIGKNEYGNAIITKDIVVEVRIRRRKKNDTNTGRRKEMAAVYSGCCRG